MAHKIGFFAVDDETYINHLEEIIKNMGMACKYALENLKPKGSIKKDFSGHNAIAGLNRAFNQIGVKAAKKES